MEALSLCLFLSIPLSRDHCLSHSYMGFPGDTDGKEFACNAGDPGSIPELERSPGEGNSNPYIQYSCLENSKDRGAWWTTVHGVTKSRTRLSNWHFHFSFLHTGPPWTSFFCAFIPLSLNELIYSPGLPLHL